MYKSLIEVEKKRQASMPASTKEVSLYQNDLPRGTLINNRKLLALSPASSFASANGNFIFN